MSDENIRVGKSVSDLQLFLDETIVKSHFFISTIKISDQMHWHLDNDALSHSSGGFFHISGLVNKNTKQEKLVLYQPQGAYNGMALYKSEDTAYLLLQARIEPGNTGICQFGPTIQSTPANYMKLHGGKDTPYLNLFFGYDSALASPIGNNTQIDLGKQYFQKSKILNYVEVNEMLETQENMIWVPLNVISQVISFDNYLNTDLRSMISVFDWDLFITGNNSNKIPSEQDAIPFNVLAESYLGRNHWELSPLSKLQHWQVQDEGIIAIKNSDPSVFIYHISCTNREVKTWSQPLYCSPGQGLVVLLMRYVAQSVDLLVTVTTEFGVSGEKAVLPSYLAYPGEDHSMIEFQCTQGRMMMRMKLSEEGGRFYQDENDYRVILVDEDFKTTKNQYWIKANTLKTILKSSNLAVIQLRVISSLILDKLNPNSVEYTKDSSRTQKLPAVENP